MSFGTMSAEIQGQAPIPALFGQILVNRSWKKIQRQNEWSFNFLDFAIPTPSAVSTGTVTLIAGSNQVVGNAIAAAAWIAMGLVIPITTRQFRVGQGTIYNIVAFDGVNTLTLDQSFVDDVATGAGKGYQIFKCYYNAPQANFIWFDTINDPVTGYPLRTTLTRQELIDIDPQRLQGSLPASVLPYKINLQPGNFFGFPMFEIWPPPLAGLTYTATGTTSGAGFVLPSDIVTPPLDEDLVIERAKIEAYEWCIVNPDKCPKGDYRFALGKCQKEYDRLYDEYWMLDESISHRHKIPYAERREFYLNLPWVSQLTGTASFEDSL